jgi:hypothetical protein
MKSQKCYQLSKTWNRLEICTTKGFDSVATILPLLKPGAQFFLQIYTIAEKDMSNTLYFGSVV